MPSQELLTPVEYLLRVMNDPAVKMEDRIEIAFTLLPYCHKVKTPSIPE